VRGVLLAFVGAVAVVFAGCGGSSSSVYNADRTQQCLTGHGLASSHADADYIVLGAPGGGYLVTVPPTRVNVSFWRSHADAERTLTSYRDFGAGDDSSIYAQGNAVLSWDDQPSTEERSLVDGCLR
jgi:hypothetical protein